MITITTKSTFPFTKNIALTPLGRECALTIDNARSALAGHLPRERQNLLVYLVRLLGRVNGRTRLMKLLFLLQKEYGIVNVSYKFIPYRFGPYSDEVLEDIHELICRSILIEKDIVYKTDDGTSLNLKSYSLSSVGDQAAKRISLGLPRVVKNNFSALRNDYGTMPLRQLLEYTYDKYPEFATESQIRQDVRNPRRYSFSDFCDDRVMCA
jgi:hypothetical protein